MINFIRILLIYFNRYPRLLDILIISICLIIFVEGISLVFDTSNNWVNWKYDDAEHLSIAYNLYHGKGFTRDFIDLGADTADTNIPHLQGYDEISNHLRNKFPLYFVLLGGWLTLFQADYSNWNLYGSIFNSFISGLAIIAFYFFVKKNFGLNVALLSGLLLAIMPGLVWFAVRIRPDVLAFLFIILTLYYGLNSITNRNAVLIGILAASSHFSHTIGLLPGLAVVIYFLMKRRVKAAFITVAVWTLILVPWLVRNYLIFGDALQGTGIPIPRDILIKIGLVSKDAPNINVNDLGPLMGTSITKTIEGMIGQFDTIYGMEYFLILISFSLAAYVCFNLIKKVISTTRGRIFSILAITTYSLLICYTFLFKSESDNIGLHIFLLFIFPFSVFLYTKLFSRYKDLFSVHRNDAYLLIAIFVLLSFVPYFMYAQVTGRIVPEVRIILQSLYLLLPLSVVGLWKLTSILTGTYNRQNRSYIAIIVFSTVTVLFSSFIISTGINDINSYHKRFGELGYQIEMHDWINQNIPVDSKFASDLPHAGRLRTGHEAVNFAHAYKDDITYENWIIKKFDVDYLVFYYFKDIIPGRGLINLDLGELKLEKVYQGQNGGLIYKVI